MPEKTFCYMLLSRDDEVKKWEVGLSWYGKQCVYSDASQMAVASDHLANKLQPKTKVALVEVSSDDELRLIIQFRVDQKSNIKMPEYEAAVIEQGCFIAAIRYMFRQQQAEIKCSQSA